METTGLCAARPLPATLRPITEFEERVAERSNAWVRALSAVSGLADGDTLAQRLPALAERSGPRPALISDAALLTYGGLLARANQYGRWALRQGLLSGEVVGLMMPNCADYVAIWVGISGVGGVAALLNTGLRQDALTHAIAVVTPHHVLVGAALAEAVEAVRPGLPPGTNAWVHGAGREG